MVNQQIKKKGVLKTMNNLSATLSVSGRSGKVQITEDEMRLFGLTFYHSVCVESKDENGNTVGKFEKRTKKSIFPSRCELCGSITFNRLITSVWSQSNGSQEQKSCTCWDCAHTQINSVDASTVVTTF